MNLLDFLIGRAQVGEAAVTAAPVPAGRPERSPPTDMLQDDAEMEMVAPVDKVPGGEPLAGPVQFVDQFACVIDYCDAHGAFTRRRIIPISLQDGPNAPMLTAKCLERKALRVFRVDRIDCFIDFDGEVHPPEDFIRFHLDVDVRAFGPTPEQVASREYLRKVKGYLRAPVSILVLMAKADDDFHSEELEVICLYIEDAIRQACELEQLERLCTAEELDLLTDFARKMRPASESLPGYVIKALEEVRYERTRLLEDALNKVMEADGVKQLSEEMLFADIETTRRKHQDRAIARRPRR